MSATDETPLGKALRTMARIADEWQPTPAPTVTQAVEVPALAQAPAPAGETDAEVLRKAADILAAQTDFPAPFFTWTPEGIRALADRLPRPSPDRETA